MQATPEKSIESSNNPLQLLLFVDKRPSSREQVRKVRGALNDLRAEYEFELQIIDVSEQPYLAEHFRLIATPALIKIHPEPRQTLAGTNIVEQLKHWWPHWQRAIAEHLEKTTQPNRTDVRSLLPLSSTVEGDSRPRAVDPTDLPIAQAAPTEVIDYQSGFGSISQSAELLLLADEVFQLKREKEELEHQLQFKDQIIAMLAHDLRNPLTATSIALETLEMGYSSKDGFESRLTPVLTLQLLKHARTQTRVIDRMVTDILQASRGVGSEIRIQPQRLDLGALCLDVLAHLRERFDTKSQRIEQDIPSDLPVVLADGERVRQVLVNLLDNAAKYTPVGGIIQLSVLHRTMQKVQVSICDNGPGIPPENRDRIFEERFRLERDEHKDGYGIGLSLCQRIVRAHYGQIWVDSTTNQGSCFHFTLPVFRGR